MRKLNRRSAHLPGLGLILALCIGATPRQQIAGGLSGCVTDKAGAVVAGAALSLVRKNGAESRSVTNSQGAYSLAGLAPGGYTLRVEAPGFAPYENDQIEVHAGGRHKLDITLQAAIEGESNPELQRLEPCN